MQSAARLVQYGVRTSALRSCQQVPFQQQRGMANLKELKVRMASVKNIQKITASMKLVAAARMKSAQLRMENSRPFWAAANAALEPKSEKTPTSLNPKNKNLLIVLTSDRGLCGAINNSLVRKAKEFLRQDPNAQVVIIGEKGKAGLQREFGVNFACTATDVGKKQLNFGDVVVVAEAIAELEFDTATILSNKFVSVLTFETLIRSIKNRNHLIDEADFTQYDFEGEKPTTLTSLFEFHLASLLYSALTENAAAELAARMTSMDNASRNAKDVYDKLSLTYNRQRQAAITTELTEIIAGTEALQ